MKTFWLRLLREDEGQHLIAYAFMACLTTLIVQPELVAAMLDNLAALVRLYANQADSLW